MEEKSMRDMFRLGFGEEVANCVTHGSWRFYVYALFRQQSYIPITNQGANWRPVCRCSFYVCF